MTVSNCKNDASDFRTAEEDLGDQQHLEPFPACGNLQLFICNAEHRPGGGCIVGTCTDMCPPEERALRERTQAVRAHCTGQAAFRDCSRTV